MASEWRKRRDTQKMVSPCPPHLFRYCIICEAQKVVQYQPSFELRVLAVLGVSAMKHPIQLTEQPFDRLRCIAMGDAQELPIDLIGPWVPTLAHTRNDCYSR